VRAPTADVAVETRTRTRDRIGREAIPGPGRVGLEDGIGSTLAAPDTSTKEEAQMPLPQLEALDDEFEHVRSEFISESDKLAEPADQAAYLLALATRAAGLQIALGLDALAQATREAAGKI
jgi:hypothetical protein